MSTQRTLPPEIHDHIIDYLHDDKPALANCSLTTWGWLATSRFHMFRVIKLSYPTIHTLETFTEFLHSTSGIAGYIRDLSVLGSDSKGSPMQLTVTVSGIANCVGALPGLHTFRLSGAWWKDGRSSSQEWLPRSYSLKRFELQRIFTTPHAIFDTVSCFPTLESLHTECVFWTSPVNRPSQSNHPVPIAEIKLQELTVGSGSSYNMLQRFLPVMRERIPVSHLRSLSLDFEQSEPCKETDDFMSYAALHLESLHLKFGNNIMMNSMTETLVENIRFSSCKALRVLRVDLPGDLSSEFHPTESWSLLYFILPQLSPTIQELTISHKLDPNTLQAHLGDLDWNMVDDLISGFKDLRTLTVSAESPSASCSRDIAKAYTSCFFEQRLLKLHKRRLLRFEYKFVLVFPHY
ncbi:hypothetical protein EW026_g4878 [Hermanssonia centrifuga]|uniref:F-box domain-containing protein n=1 Tax=Hermanssonia centrifuga TaxID=98765 RepID=A0A4S4KGG3_9APHY|nr:hypothetical protein EW026_g4878 [Hermanssonia centrifuga]